MARVTVEDCIENVSDRFNLVLLAARRAKQIATGGQITVDRDNDKDSVVALREIADKTIDLDNLEEDLIYSFSKRRFYEPRFDQAAIEDNSSENIQEMLQSESRQMSVPTDDAAEASGMDFGDEDADIED